MNNKVIRIFLLVSLMGLQGCDFLWNFFEPQFNVKEKDYIPGVVDGDPEPPYATPQMSKSSLLGIDKDNDGVRDDIEIWINRNVDEPKIRQYLKVYIKRQNRFLTCSGENDCLNAYRVYWRSSVCFSIIRPPSMKLETIFKYERLVRSLFYNTKLRKKEDGKMSHHLSVTTWGGADYLGKYLLKDHFCEFETESIVNSMKEIWSYENRSTFVRNVKEGLYEKYFDLHVNISDYPNICDEFSGPEKNLCN